jgi:LTXXQ motif family protein
MMQSMIGENVMAAHIERRIAFLKTELNIITDEQQPLWNAVAEALRTNAKGMAERPPAMMGGSGTLLEKLAAREKAISAQMESIRRLRTAFDPLYTGLTPEQKKTADCLMTEPRSVLGMGMM